MRRYQYTCILQPSPPTPSLPPGSFETLHNDIQFGVFFEESDDSKVGPEEVPGEEYGEEVIIETQLVDSYLGPVTGTIPLTRPGRLTMVWDNG